VVKSSASPVVSLISTKRERPKSASFINDDDGGGIEGEVGEGGEDSGGQAGEGGGG
jgi:hypothetical protein